MWAWIEDIRCAGYQDAIALVALLHKAKAGQVSSGFRIVEQASQRRNRRTIPTILPNCHVVSLVGYEAESEPGSGGVPKLKTSMPATSLNLACSSAWDTSDIIVVGADDADMAGAVNRIRALQGGAVVFENGEILAELPLPIFGIMSDLPIETIADRLQEIKNAVSDLGVPFPDPLLTLITLTGAAIPYLRICEEGLVNLKDGKTVKLIIS